MLPELSARSAFGTALPFTEFAIGALLVVEAFTREALFAGGLLMIPLVFGTIPRSEWATAGGRCSTRCSTPCSGSHPRLLTLSTHGVPVG
jgi:hypothetical protein